MPLSRRSQRMNTAIWPGFVDAMTGLLLVLMFVLTIFMVIQFVLRETITGQETELDALADEVAALSSALGLEETRTATLTADLATAANEASAQAALISRLTIERDETAAALVAAQNQITGFEAQVAGLLSDRTDRDATIAELETARDTLLTEQEALNLALATARTEIDAGAEAARLAAARREALEAMIADLETGRDADATAISELEAAQLADAAAAQALRDRLANADAELTAMTLALEEQRREAEETLTLLAATQSARDDLNLNLAAALLAQQQAERALVGAQEQSGDLDAQLAAAIQRADIATAALEAAQADRDVTQTMSEDLTARLAEALLAQEALQAEVAGLSENATNVTEDNATLRARLTAALTGAETAQSKAEQQAALLAAANAQLSEEEALSAESQRQVALLNAQVAELRNQVGTLQSLLDVANDADADAQVQIEQLGSQLNTALARVAAEERRRRALEEAERLRLEEETARLAAEAQNLERFKSDFFGQLREVLEGQDGVQIVGDRFVFSSEVLFRPGEAELSFLGRGEIAKVADILLAVADDIPDGIDWIIRVDGHTDNIPLSGTGQFRDNWELSQARALSVVRYMDGALGLPPQRLAANGFGEYQPINPADTAAARAQNRRIEIKLTER